MGLYTAEEVETQEEHDARVQKEGEVISYLGRGHHDILGEGGGAKA